jgi:hypothetical protein
VKQVIGNAAWTVGRPQGRWRLPLSHSLFSGMAHARLRGLAAFVVSDDDSGVWRLRVTPPQMGDMRRLDGSVQRIDQSFLPPCRFGRVGLRSAALSPDRSGSNNLFNASPIGEWTVEIEGRSTTGRDPSALQDITIDLGMVIRSI